MWTTPYRLCQCVHTVLALSFPHRTNNTLVKLHFLGRVCIRLHYFAPARWRHASPLRTGVLCVAGPAEQLGWRFGLWILLNSIWCWVQKMLQHRWTQCAAILKKVKKSRNGLPCACYSCVVGYTRLYAVPGIGKWAVLIDSDKTQRNCIKAITWWSNWEDI